MAPSDNNNKNLGDKHKEYNKRVHDVISSQNPLEEKEFAKTDNDLDNLMKIDIASHNKDIDYILSVLKSNDMFYVSRAIKQSPWLADDQYATIINPEYLNEHLIPIMKTKATIKLLKHVRHYLKNENRAEEFYKNESNGKVAAKWLSRCSVPFIENNINKHIEHLTHLEFKRLCERSATIFQAAMKDVNRGDLLKATSFLLHTHADMYLDVFDRIYYYNRPNFGPTATELIMKKTPDRITNNFTKYVNHIHIPTFVEYIKREQVKDFLFNLVNKETKDCDELNCRKIFQFKQIKHFIKRMPKDEQFEFVKKVFLDSKNIMSIQDETLLRGTEMYAIKKICIHIGLEMPIYKWYEFAPYNIAFDEIKKLIHLESNIREKYQMYGVLSKCATENTKNLISFLTYYSKNSLNDDITQKRNFINKLISETEMYKNNEETWKAFTDIINNMNIYTENDNNIYIQIIIMHDILHDKQATEPNNEKFSVESFKNYRKTLNQDEQNKVFAYIYNHVEKQVQRHTVQTEVELTEAVKKVEQLLNVLLDWDKELADFPFALEKIKELIQIRKEKSWKVNMSSLYNKKKSWKRLMFEESVVLNPSQNVFVNALKHDPGLLVRYKTDVDAVSCDDSVSLKRLLRKLRIYWSDTLGESWAKSYLDRMDKVGGYNALTRGICTILTQEPLLDIITKYAPAQPKIDWNNIDEVTLGLQRCLAKYMHIARPQPTADAILLYAKGDFLQYSLPSLLAIYYDMSYVESQEQIPKLLNAPVSLQKHGLRFAFSKLKHDELKMHLSNIWQSSKNISIRAVTFGLLFDLLCKEKNVERAKELWEILEVFMENLSFKEDKKIYEKLLKVNEVPEAIKPKFLVKSYNFLKTLLPHIKIDPNVYEDGIRNLVHYTRTIMEFMSPEFVADIITEYLDANFFKHESLDDNMLEVTSSYLLCAKDEETQNNKYNKILLPLIKRSLNQWNEIHKDIYFVRRNFQNLLQQFNRDLEEYIVKRKMIVPTKMFKNIQKELDELPLPQNYVILRMWKLIVKVTELIEKKEIRDDWKQICTEMVPEFGTFCLDVLKQDVKAHFPCIYILFKTILNKAINNVMDEIINLQIYEVLLTDKDFTQAYLLVLSMLPYFGRNCYYDENDESNKKALEIKDVIHKSSSIEIKMHYYCKYEDDTDCPLGL